MEKMRNQRYNIDDLMMQLREQGVGDIRDVEYAILEPSGKLSVFQNKRRAGCIAVYSSSYYRWRNSIESFTND